jgi:hypothetical protein
LAHAYNWSQFNATRRIAASFEMAASFQKTPAVPTKVPNIVIPAKAGIHLRRQQNMDPRFRGDDESCGIAHSMKIARARRQLPQ